jgi:hypothetical protein
MEREIIRVKNKTLKAPQKLPILGLISLWFVSLVFHLKTEFADAGKN